jgi:hypothetical protein
VHLSNRHPLRTSLEHKFANGLVRRCGYPHCPNLMRVDVMATAGRDDKRFCSSHCRVQTGKLRRKLRDSIRDLDTAGEANFSPDRRANHHDPLSGATKEDLQRWRTRLEWALAGLPA